MLHGFAVGPRFGGPDDAMFDGIVGMSAPPAVPGRGALPRLILGPGKETLKVPRGPHGEAEEELMSRLSPFRDVSKDELGGRLLQQRINLNAAVCPFDAVGRDGAHLLPKLRGDVQHSFGSEAPHTFPKKIGQDESSRK